jgi:hypothetical protein
MPLLAPSLLHLVGQGFRGDHYAADGHNLRWSFDPRLGFPRTAFCIDRRRSVLGKEGQVELAQRRDAFPRFSLRGSAGGVTVREVVADYCTVTRPGGDLQAPSAVGIPLADLPLRVDLHGGNEPTGEAACWVEVTVRLGSRFGRVEAVGVLADRGTYHVVARAAPEDVDDTQTHVSSHPDPRLATAAATKAGAEAVRPPVVRRYRPVETGDLPDPEVGLGPPAVRAAERPLYEALVATDAEKYRNVTYRWLLTYAERLRAAGIEVGDDSTGTFDGTSSDSTQVKLVLTAPRLDAVHVQGEGYLEEVAYITARDLDDRGGWEQIACFPVLTEDERYARDNERWLADGGNAKQFAADLLLGSSRPNGVEPLDDPEVPPTRAASDGELERRYLEPWVEQLEPWFRRVMTDSASGALHQSEVVEEHTLDVLGQHLSDGVIAGAPPDRAMRVPLLPMLLGAASAFQVARQLGLGAVLDAPDDQAWDYRVRGSWLDEDLAAWPAALQRQLGALAGALAEATPAETPALQADILAVTADLAATQQLVSALVAENGPGPIELAALCIGVRVDGWPMFGSPSSLSITAEGPAAPVAGLPLRGIARLAWPLRPRAATANDEAIPMGAALARDTAGTSGRFAEVINPVSPDSGMPLAVLSPDDPMSPGAGGTTALRDRAVPPNTDLRYGVSEVDPFGRWSPFREAAFRWNYVVPPDAPAVQATLAQPATDLALNVCFSWPMDTIAGMEFFVHLRRSPIPAGADPHAWSLWGTAERIPGSGAPAYRVTGGGSGAANHDGMPVTVATADDAGRREFTVTFTGLQLARDVLSRATVYAGVSTRDDGGVSSTGVGGPALATHIQATPPPVPAMPPEPLSATYADAQGRSSITLTWSAAADTRYTLLRAGERDIVSFCRSKGISTTAYVETNPANLRAAALKVLAVQARAAFQPCSPPQPAVPQTGTPPRDVDPATWPAIPAGTLAVTDRLEGTLRTLVVYTPVGRTRNGVIGPWPSTAGGFAAVQVPQVPLPATPVVLRAAWEPPLPTPVTTPALGSARAELVLAKPGPRTAPVVRFDVYRASLAADAEDHRRMKPMHSVAASGWVAVTVAGGTQDVLRWYDTSVQPWRSYYYRVVARAPALGGGSGTGTPSPASPPIRIDTLSTTAPAAPTSLVASRTGDTVTVSFDASAPETPYGDFRLALLDATRQVVLASAKASDARTSSVSGSSYALATEAARTGDSLAIRITDPTGRSTISPTVSTP